MVALRACSYLYQSTKAVHCPRYAAQVLNMALKIVYLPHAVAQASAWWLIEALEAMSAPPDPAEPGSPDKPKQE
jgi:hypothetical protein